MTGGESVSRILVNGSLLPQFVGRVVTIYGTVNGISKGSMFDIITTDKHLVSITLRKPLSEPIAGLVEVHGIVKDKDTIICNYYMVFPADIASSYDAEVTNEAVKIIHSVPNIWANTMMN